MASLGRNQRIPKLIHRQALKALLRPLKRVPRFRNGPGAAVAVAPGLFLAAPVKQGTAAQGD